MAHEKTSKRVGEKVRLDKLDMKAHFAERDDYQDELSRMQLAMLRVQEAYYHEGRRAIIVFEGWDAAGKGGTIRRLTERLDPRGCKVWPIAAPQARGAGAALSLSFLDASARARHHRGVRSLLVWPRAGRARRGLRRKHEWKRAYREINEFERMLTDDGVRIVKLFLHITPEGATRPLHRASEAIPTSTGRSPPTICATARAGTITKRRSTTCSTTPRPSTRRGMRCRPTTNGRRGSMRSRRW